MVQVTELGYMGLGVKNLDEWKDYAANILALEVVDEGEPGRYYLRMDYWHHRFILEEDGTDDLNYLGFRVAGVEEFCVMHRKLIGAGVEVRIGTYEEAAERRVLEVMKLKDASGFPIEIFHGPQVQADKPFHPGRPMHGRFKTGAGGLGHLIQAALRSDKDHLHSSELRFPPCRVQGAAAGDADLFPETADGAELPSRFPEPARQLQISEL